MVSAEGKRGAVAALLSFVFALLAAALLAGCAGETASDEGSADGAGDAVSTVIDEVVDAIVDDGSESDGQTDIDELLSSYATASFTYLAGGTYDGYFHVAGEDYLVYTFVANVSSLPLTWYVADFDSDGQSELLVIGTDIYTNDEGGVYVASADAVLVMYEVDVDADYAIEAAAEYTIGSAAISSYEEATTRWGLYEQDGVVYIGFESWGQASYLADSIALAFVALAYDGSDFVVAVDAGVSGSDLGDGGDFSDTLEEAGIVLDFEALTNNTATILGTGLNATIICTTTTTPVIDLDEFEAWTESGDSEIIGTSIVVTGQGNES